MDKYIFVTLLLIIVGIPLGMLLLAFLAVSPPIVWVIMASPVMWVTWVWVKMKWKERDQ